MNFLLNSALVYVFINVGLFYIRNFIYALVGTVKFWRRDNLES